VGSRSDRRPLDRARELQELDARIARLQARLVAGDADLMPDEIQLAIDRAQAKRRELQAAQPAAKQTAKVLAMLPKVAGLYLKQIKQGLDGEPRAAAKARIVLRDMLGPITMTPGANGELWASYRLSPAALVKAAGTRVSGQRDLLCSPTPRAGARQGCEFPEITPTGPYRAGRVR
jgi:site-specific DNA recombinase